MITQKMKDYMLRLANEEGVVDKAQLAERTYAYMSTLIGNYEKDENLRRIPLHVLISKMSRMEYEIACILNEMYDRKIIGGFKKVTASKKFDGIKKEEAQVVGKSSIFKYECMLIELED